MVDCGECGWWTFCSKRVRSAERAAEQWRMSEQAADGASQAGRCQPGAADGEAALFESLKGDRCSGILAPPPVPPQPSFPIYRHVRYNFFALSGWVHCRPAFWLNSPPARREGGRRAQGCGERALASDMATGRHG